MASKTILIVDDDETIHQILKKLLQDRGFNTLHAQSGQGGLYEARENPDISAILLDRQMPYLNGNDVLKDLQSDPRTSHIPVLMLTSDNSVADVADSLKHGAIDYIVKPFDNENLIIRLKNVLKPTN